MQVRHKISLIGDLAARRVIRQFANKYHLVYFGSVDAREDDHELVRGVTVSATHADSHYTVGTLQSRDIILVQRKNTLTFPGKASSHYKWLIMQIDLDHDNLPHIFIDSHHHDEIFYANLFTALPQFLDIRGYLAGHDPAFLKHCKVFAFPHAYESVLQTLRPEITRTLAQHFLQFDYEIADDRLYVYSAGNVVTMAVLQEMLRVGIWLADVLDGKKIPE